MPTTAAKKQEPPPVAPDPRVALIPLSLIDPNPWQPRTTFKAEDVEALAESIERAGLSQYPALRPAGERFQIQSGEMRFRAYKLINARRPDDARYQALPAVVREVSDEDMSVLALEENRQRRDLSPIEEARAIKRHLEEFGVTQTAMGQKLNLAQETISNMVRVLSLPPEVLALVESGALPFSGARSLLRFKGPKCCHTRVMLAIVEGVRPYNGSIEDYLKNAGLDYGALKGFKLLTERHNYHSHERPVFDVAAFKERFKDEVHVLPDGAEITCNAGAWNEWQGRASKELAARKQKRAQGSSIAEVLKPGATVTQQVDAEGAQPAESWRPRAREDRPVEPRSLLPEEIPDAPAAGRDELPKGFDLERARQALARVQLEPESADQATLDAALGSRARVYGAGSMGYGEYERLDFHDAEGLLDRAECTKGCVWGFAWMHDYAGDGPETRRFVPICTNLHCFRRKRRLNTSRRIAQGKAGLEEENAQLAEALLALEARGGLRMERPAARLILEAMRKHLGSAVVGDSSVRPDDWLVQELGLVTKRPSWGDWDRKVEGRTLKERLEGELDGMSAALLCRLTVKFALMLIRGSTKPSEWQPVARPWIALLSKGDGAAINATLEAREAEGEGKG